MNPTGLRREWNFVIRETHKEKPNADNLLKRELIFTLQNLLSEISKASTNKSKLLIENIYLKTKNQFRKVY